MNSRASYVNIFNGGSTISKGNLGDGWGDIFCCPGPVVSNRGIFCTPRGHLAVSGDIFGCYHFRVGVPGTQWVEARDAAKHPTKHRMTPSATGYPIPNVNWAKVRKPSLTLERIKPSMLDIQGQDNPSPRRMIPCPSGTLNALLDIQVRKIPT